MYDLAKRAPALFAGFDALGEAADLWGELETYAAAEVAANAERAERAVIREAQLERQQRARLRSRSRRR